MHIFLTNDDGYEAPGIVAMAKKLVALGRVTVIAPDKGRSSCSSSLSLQTYLRLWYKESYGENITVLACSGTTADCAKLALCHWLKSDMPDLIVSGINNG
ncbi:MAG: 5'/3'-nucleotidase SurE, partial [Dialister sp.]|nr:5'/3'-nucleotidase SurE [Dialister sp.]